MLTFSHFFPSLTLLPLVYFSLGSNVGNRAEYLQIALKCIGEEVGEIVKYSEVIETAPWGIQDLQNSYLNQAIAVQTTLSPLELLRTTQTIENNLGRQDKGKRAPRTIDIDILYYDDLVLDLPELTIPHPYAHCRTFVLDTMLQIAPDLIHPLEKKTQHNLRLLCD